MDIKLRKNHMRRTIHNIKKKLYKFKRQKLCSLISYHPVNAENNEREPIFSHSFFSSINFTLPTLIIRSKINIINLKEK